MVVSDAERREIAQRLRDIEDITLLEQMTDGELLDMLAEEIGFVRGEESFETGLFHRIADLINPW